MECNGIRNVRGYGMYGDMECNGIWNVTGYVAMYFAWCILSGVCNVCGYVMCVGM